MLARTLPAIAAFLLWSAAAVAEPQTVTIPDGDVALTAQLTAPARASSPPTVVALHGCGGPWPERDQQWRTILNDAGFATLFPDSFRSRGLGSQCKVRNRTVSPNRERRADTVAAVRWLTDAQRTKPGDIVVMGWSNGGSTVLAAAAQGVMPPGAVRGFIAFYPGCSAFAGRDDWAPSAPLLILMGASDDWTPAEPCRALAERFPDRITLVAYPDTYHDFDVPGRPITARAGLAYTAGGSGVAHTGTNPAARADAIERVLAFLRPR